MFDEQFEIMNLFGAPQTARFCAPAQMEKSLDLSCACQSCIFLLQVHLQDAPCPVSIKGKGKLEPVLN